MDEIIKEPEYFEYNNISIAHWNFPHKDFDDYISAAKYAWSCLEDLAKIFCQLNCDKRTCNIKDPIPRLPDGNVSTLWNVSQKIFHKSLSYLPLYCFDIDGCPACAVVKAFACFPVLINYSPVPPVSTVRIDAIDWFPDNRYAGDSEESSFPCFRIITEYRDGFSETETIRELALLNLDFNNLPVMPPWKLGDIKKKLIDGKKIVTNIYQLSNSESTTQPVSSNDSSNSTISSTTDLRNVSLLSGWRKIKCLIKSSETWEIFIFNDIQAKIVEVLYYSQDHEMHKASIFEKIERKEQEKYRMDKVFKNHNNWRNLIKPNKSNTRKRGFWYLDI